jgi:cytochrome c biogenesis protein CcdA
MQEWIYQVINSETISFSVLIAGFLLGALAAVTSCCNFAVIGAVVGYSGSISVSQKKKSVITSGLAFLLGTVISLGIIGGLTGYISNFIGESMGNYWKIFAGVLSIFFGLATMNALPFNLPSVTFSKAKGSGFFSALLFGLMIGGLSTACNTACNPIFPVVLGVAFLKANFVWGMSILFSFALGYGLPLAAGMIGIGLGLGKLTKSFSAFNTAIKYIAGIILIFIGFYFLITL